MSTSGIRTLLICRNRWYLAPEVEALNRDFECTYSAGRCGLWCFKEIGIMKKLICLAWRFSLLAAVALGVVAAHAMPPSSQATTQGNPEEGTRSTALSKKDAARLKTVQLPLSFEANQGQTASAVKFTSRGDGYALFLTPEEAVFKLGPAKESKKGTRATQGPSILRMKLLGADNSVRISGAEPLPGTANYLIGNDPKQWRTGVATYRKVHYQGLYPGVDAVFYGNQLELEYDFTVAPGVDPMRISLEFSGARPKLTREGDIVLKLKGDTVLLHKPIAYQGTGASRHEVGASYTTFAGNRVRFQIGPYDRNEPLVIDPVLSYASYLGGSGNDTIGTATGPGNLQVGVSQGIAVDSTGSVYVAGNTFSIDFPMKNPYQGAPPAKIAGVQPGQWASAFVTKFSSDGSSLVYSTYLGGNGADHAYAIAVDSSGDAYVTGLTTSPNFPISAGAYQAICAPIPNNKGASTASSNCNSSDYNVFATKLNAAGTGIVYSTFLGGYANWAYATAIAVDGAGRAYIAGNETDICSTNYTFQSCFPTTSGAIIGGDKTGGRSPQYAFVAVFDPTGAQLVYSSLFGGMEFSCLNGCGETWATGIEVDANGYFYLIGDTKAGNLPTTAGVIQPTSGPLNSTGTGMQIWRGFVAKFNPVTSAGGVSLAYATYLGGQTQNQGDYISGIAVDNASNAYIAGYTNSKDFPVTSGAYQTVCGPNGGTCAGAHVTKLNPSGSAILWSTYVGGGKADGSDSLYFTGPIQLDGRGNIYIMGQAGPGFPLINPVEPAVNSGSQEVLAAVLNGTGSNLLFSTRIGSGGLDTSNPAGLVADGVGNIYLAGNNLGPDLITTSGAFQRTTKPSTGLYTPFVAKVYPFAASPIDMPLSAEGAATAATKGSASATSSGYAVVGVNSAGTPYGTAVFSIKQNGVTVTETGVPASPPTTSARIFIDYRTGVNAVPARSDAGTVSVNTGIAVVNYANATANVTYTLRDLNGAKVPGASGQGTIAAGAHFATFIDHIKDVASGFSLPSNFQTAVQFATLDITSDQPLSILALRQTTNQRNDTLYTTTPVADLTKSLNYNPVYFPQFADGGGYTTSLLLLNTSNGVESGTLQILDDNGAPLVDGQAGGTTASSFPYSIPSGGAFRFQTDGSPAAINQGWVRLIPDSSSPTPVSSGVFGYNLGSILVSESGIPATVPTTHARVYVDLSGNHDTGLAIANVGNTDANITINAFQTNGTSAVGTSQGLIPLAPGGHAAKFADNFITGLPAGFTGVLDISSTTPFAALTVRSLTNERGDPLMATFPVADANQPAPSPIVFPQIADGGGYVTQFILISPGGAATTVLYYYDGTGTPINF